MLLLLVFIVCVGVCDAATIKVALLVLGSCVPHLSDPPPHELPARPDDRQLRERRDGLVVH